MVLTLALLIWLPAIRCPAAFTLAAGIIAEASLYTYLTHYQVIELFKGIHPLLGVTASIIVLGIFAYRLLAVAALPTVDFPTINIQGQLPGASAETMAASVAAPIERQLSTIAGITSLTSSSSLGITSITIQFDLNRNIDGAALDVQTALTVAARKLPVEMTIPPSFRKVNPGDFPIMYISLVSATLPLSACRKSARRPSSAASRSPSDCKNRNALAAFG